MTNPNDIVGHKTFSDGPMSFRHEPLTRAEADELWDKMEKAKADREQRMPDEQSAIRALFDARLRLTELGWREGIYCPKDGTSFRVIEAGSTGIFDCTCKGEWPSCTWTTFDEHDAYPSSQAPLLFKLYPEDQAKYDARMAEAAARYRAETSQ
jgi:hypothetical protein